MDQDFSLVSSPTTLNPRKKNWLKWQREYWIRMVCAGNSAHHVDGSLEEKAHYAMDYLEDYFRNVTHLPSYIHEYKCSQDQSWIPGAIEEYGHSVLQMPV